MASALAPGMLGHSSSVGPGDLTPQYFGKDYQTPQKDGYSYFNSKGNEKEAWFNAITGKVITPQPPIPDKVLDNLTIYYEVGSSKIDLNDPRNKQALNVAKVFLEENPDCRIDITSLTSSTGSQTTNQALSEQRTAAAMTALLESNIDSEQLNKIDGDNDELHLKNLGESKALAETGDEVENGEYRVTQLSLVKPGREVAPEVEIYGKHIVYIDKNTNESLIIEDNSKGYKLEESFLESYKDKEASAEIIGSEIHLVVDVNNQSSKTIKLEDLEAETLEKLKVGTYDSLGGKANNLARFDVSDKSIVVQVSQDLGKTWRNVCTIEGEGLTNTKLVTVTPHGKEVSVDVALPHVPSSPEVSSQLIVPSPNPTSPTQAPNRWR